MSRYTFWNVLNLSLLFVVLLVCRGEGTASTPVEPQIGQMLVKAQVPEAGKWPINVKIVLPIEARPEVVWKVLTDYEHMTEFVPHMKSCKVVERKGDVLTVEEVYRHLLVTMELLLSIKESPPDRIDFRRVGGNMKVYDGHWSIKPHNPDGTLLTLEVAVQPGFFAPRGFTSWILKKELPEGVLSIREKAMRDSGKPIPPGGVEVIQ
jgi:ribosome-associated toxin RatA of RatAB toxin-antitoxin module